MNGNKVKIGIIGMGIMGSMYARLVQENAEAKLAAFCDINPQRCEEMSNHFQVASFSDSGSMIDHADLDAVLITTPDHLHSQPVLLAAENDLHMMVEKPLALNLDKAIEMQTSIERSKSIAMMAHVFRWYAPFVLTKSDLQSQKYGIPLSMNMRIDDRIYVPTKMICWADKTTPGWFLLSHAVDLACWYSDSKPIKVYAHGVKNKLVSMGIDTYDIVHFDVTFESGFVASLEACWILPDSLPSMSGSWCTVISSEGGHYINVLDQMIQRAGKTYESPATIRLEMHGRLAGLQSFMLQSFLDSILREKEVVSKIIDGVTAVAVLQSAHESLVSGKIETINY